MRKLFLALLICLSFAGHADELDKKKWEERSEGLEYPLQNNEFQPIEEDEVVKDYDAADHERTPARKKGKPLTFERGESTGALGAFGQVMLYVLLGIAIIALIVYILRSRRVSRKPQPELRIEIDPDNPEELVRTELEMELDEARKSGNYARCLRYLFLMMLERFQTENLIVWHKHKTNGQYLNELMNHPDFRTIRSITFKYEFHWYGEHALSETEYFRIEPIFKQFASLEQT